jgi:hypothetical protein
MGQAKIRKFNGTYWTPKDLPSKPLPKPTPPIVWHYTVGACIERILSDGELHLSPMAGGHGQSILWFSANPEWEPTAAKAIIVNGEKQPLDRTDTERLYGGLYRIGVSTAILSPWTDLQQITKYKPEAITRFEDWGKKRGANPLDWWGCINKVDASHWQTIERHVDVEWRELHQNDEIPQSHLTMKDFTRPTASEISAFWKSRG